MTNGTEKKACEKEAEWKSRAEMNSIGLGKQRQGDDRRGSTWMTRDENELTEVNDDASTD
jgi:hypothetical protein